jgi:YHS domain-containing protein
VIRGLVYLAWVLVWLLIVRQVLRTVARLLGGGGSQRRPGASRPLRPAEDLVRDRVCNTYVPRSRAIVATIDGHEEYFCSTGCRERARAAVARAS